MTPPTTPTGDGGPEKIHQKPDPDPAWGDCAQPKPRRQLLAANERALARMKPNDLGNRRSQRTPKRAPQVGRFTASALLAESSRFQSAQFQSRKSERKRRRRRPEEGKSVEPRSTAGPGKPVEAIIDDKPVNLNEEQLERRRGRERKGRPVGRYQMLVHVHEGVTHIAVLEGRSLIEHYVSRPSDDVSEIHGNIYLGKVQKCASWNGSSVR